MTAPIQSLTNMEMALYGGLGTNPAAPSFGNNYMGGINALNSMAVANPYAYNNLGNINQNDYASLPSQHSASSLIAQQTQTQGQGGVTADTNADINTLVNYYKKNNVVEDEGLVGAAMGGLQFMAMENPQTLAHPFNAFKANKEASKIFSEALEQSAAAKALWKSDPLIMQDAYSQLYRVTRNAQSKFAISGWFIKPDAFKNDLSFLQDEMLKAIKSGDKDKIQKATEQLRIASQCNGPLSSPVAKIKGWFTGNKFIQKTPKELFNEAGAVGGAAEEAVAEKGLTFAKHCLKDGKGWFFFDMLFSLGKIHTAFTHKDGGVGAGIAQTGQSAVKAAGNAFGWIAGKAAGGWAGAKLGAMLGSACPGWGTAIGAVVGFIGGSLGMLAMGKVTKAVMGEDIATELETKDKGLTAQGKTELVQLVAQKLQAGEQVPPNVMQSAQNVAMILG